MHFPEVCSHWWMFHISNHGKVYRWSFVRVYGGKRRVGNSPLLSSRLCRVFPLGKRLLIWDLRKRSTEFSSVLRLLDSSQVKLLSIIRQKRHIQRGFTFLYSETRENIISTGQYWINWIWIGLLLRLSERKMRRVRWVVVIRRDQGIRLGYPKIGLWASILAFAYCSFALLSSRCHVGLKLSIPIIITQQPWRKCRACWNIWLLLCVIMYVM